MYAVVRTGGKQIRMIPGESVRVEKLSGGVGESVELEVRRADETLVLAVGRGPLGGKLEHFVAAPGP